MFNRYVIGSIISLCSSFLMLAPTDRPVVDMSAVQAPAELRRATSDELGVLVNQLLQTTPAQQAEINSNPKLGVANDQILQSISSLSRQIGQMNESMLDRNGVVSIVEEEIKSGKLVSMTAMQEAISDAKHEVAKAAEVAKTGTSDSCNCETKFAEVFRRLEALETLCVRTEKASQARVGNYPAVAGAKVSGGSTGSVSYSQTQTSFQPQVTYSQQVVSTPAAAYAVTDECCVVTNVAQPTAGYYQSTSSPVVGNGSTGGVSYSQASAPSGQAVSLPPDSDAYRIVKPREPRQVFNVEVPSNTAPPQGGVAVQCHDQFGNVVTCNQGVSASPPAAVAVPQSKLGSGRLGGADGRIMTPFR